MSQSGSRVLRPAATNSNSRSASLSRLPCPHTITEILSIPSPLRGPPAIRRAAKLVDDDGAPHRCCAVMLFGHPQAALAPGSLLVLFAALLLDAAIGDVP